MPLLRGDKEACDCSIAFQVPATMKKVIAEEASRNAMTPSRWIRVALAEKLLADGRKAEHARA